MKKALALVLALVMVFALCACGSSSSAATTEAATTEAAPAAEAAPAEAAPAAEETKTEVIITGTNGPGDCQSIAHENFAAALNELGGWDATALVSSEMGSTDDVLEQALAGANVLASSDPSRLASYVPEFGILMMPYMFDSYDQLNTLLDTELYAKWQQDFKDQGLVLLCNNFPTGFRMYVCNKEINTPSDLNGIKIRTMGSKIAVNSVNAMGAIATSMAQSDAYNGIETGVVDGGEWQIPTIYSLRMYEVCKNISLTKHFLLTCSMVCGEKWYSSLPENQQVEISETAVKVYGEAKEMVVEKEEQYLQEMKDMGVTVTEPDIDAFKEATAYLYSDDDTTGGVDYLALRDELYAQMGIK